MSGGAETITCGCELEYFDVLPRNPAGEITLNRVFWRAFLTRVQELVATSPGVRTGTSHADRTASSWHKWPTILFLPCGGKLYLDSSSRSGQYRDSYPEWATPECCDPRELARYAFAADGIVGNAFQHAADTIAKPMDFYASLYRLNCPHMTSHTKGFHESYSISHPLRERLLNPSDVWCTQVWIPFLATRSLVCGPGHLREDGVFSPSGRALKTNKLSGSVLVGQAGRGDRAVVDPRIDFFGGGRPRLQVVCGDVPSTVEAAEIQFGSTILLLYLMQARLDGGGNLPSLASDAIHDLFQKCGDYSTQAKSTQERLLRVQRQLCELIRPLVDVLPQIDWARNVLERWENAIDSVAHEDSSAPGAPPWMVSQGEVEEYARSGLGLPQIAAQLNRQCLLADSVQPPPHLITQCDDLINQPSSIPRATARAAVVHQHGNRASIDWDLVFVFSETGVESVQVLADPFSRSWVYLEDWYAMQTTTVSIAGAIEVATRVLGELAFSQNTGQHTEGAANATKCTLEFAARAAVELHLESLLSSVGVNLGAAQEQDDLFKSPLSAFRSMLGEHADASMEAIHELTSHLVKRDDRLRQSLAAFERGEVLACLLESATKPERTAEILKECIGCFQHAQELCRQAGADDKKYAVFNSACNERIGAQHFRLENWSIAAENCAKAFNLLPNARKELKGAELAHDTGVSLAEIAIKSTSDQPERFDRALEWLKCATEIATHAPEGVTRSQIRASAARRLGDCYSHLKQREDALRSYSVCYTDALAIERYNLAAYAAHAIALEKWRETVRLDSDQSNAELNACCQWIEKAIELRHRAAEGEVDDHASLAIHWRLLGAIRKSLGLVQASIDAHLQSRFHCLQQDSNDAEEIESIDQVLSSLYSLQDADVAPDSTVAVQCQRWQDQLSERENSLARAVSENKTLRQKYEAELRSLKELQAEVSKEKEENNILFCNREQVVAKSEKECFQKKAALDRRESELSELHKNIEIEKAAADAEFGSRIKEIEDREAKIDATLSLMAREAKVAELEDDLARAEEEFEARRESEDAEMSRRLHLCNERELSLEYLERRCQSVRDELEGGRETLEKERKDHEADQQRDRGHLNTLRQEAFDRSAALDHAALLQKACLENIAEQLLACKAFAAQQEAALLTLSLSLSARENSLESQGMQNRKLAELLGQREEQAKRLEARLEAEARDNEALRSELEKMKVSLERAQRRIKQRTSELQGDIDTLAKDRHDFEAKQKEAFARVACNEERLRRQSEIIEATIRNNDKQREGNQLRTQQLEALERDLATERLSLTSMKTSLEFQWAQFSAGLQGARDIISSLTQFVEIVRQRPICDARAIHKIEEQLDGFDSLVQSELAGLRQQDSNQAVRASPSGSVDSPALRPAILSRIPTQLGSKLLEGMGDLSSGRRCKCGIGLAWIARPSSLHFLTQVTGPITPPWDGSFIPREPNQEAVALQSLIDLVSHDSAAAYLLHGMPTSIDLLECIRLYSPMLAGDTPCSFTLYIEALVALEEGAIGDYPGQISLHAGFMKGSSRELTRLVTITPKYAKGGIVSEYELLLNDAEFARASSGLQRPRITWFNPNDSRG